MAIRDKCMANHDREWNRARLTGKRFSNSILQSWWRRQGGDTLLKNRKLAVEGRIRVSQRDS